MKTKALSVIIAVCAGLLGGCGKSGDAPASTPDPVTQPEAQAALFQRSVDRVNSLIAAKDFGQAQRTLESFKQYKLTPEQQAIVDKLQAQIPAN
jgi:hypothetical protein